MHTRTNKSLITYEQKDGSQRSQNARSSNAVTVCTAKEKKKDPEKPTGPERSIVARML